MRFHFYEVPGAVRFTETESRGVGARGWGRGMGSECVMGTESQFGKTRKFWRWTVVTATHPCECA